MNVRDKILEKSRCIDSDVATLGLSAWGNLSRSLRAIDRLCEPDFNLGLNLLVEVDGTIFACKPDGNLKPFEVVVGGKWRKI